MNRHLAISLPLTALACLFAAPAAAQPVLPNFSAAVFDNSLRIDNPLFPLIPHTTFTYDGMKTDPVTGTIETELIIVQVLDDTRTIAGIDSRVVRDSVWLEGLLVEDTFDWYAQDNAGHVWYLGENVTNYEYDDLGNLTGTSHPGSWETGVNGALPGYVMEAHPMLGDHYYQELYTGIAQDHAMIVGLGETQSVPYGSFTGVLHTREFSLSPDSYGDKFYAPGVGLIKEQDFATATGALLGTTRLRSVTVPEPDAAMLLFPAVWGLLVHRLRRGAPR